MDDELKAGGHYYDKVFDAINAAAHEIQFRVSMCVATPIFGAVYEIPT